MAVTAAKTTTAALSVTPDNCVNVNFRYGGHVEHLAQGCETQFRQHRARITVRTGVGKHTTRKYGRLAQWEMRCHDESGETKTVYRFLSDICDGFVRQAFVQWDLFKA